eukprot:1154201-Pelagomonas_calceolata.AAC.1
MEAALKMVSMHSKRTLKPKEQRQYQQHNQRQYQQHNQRQYQQHNQQHSQHQQDLSQQQQQNKRRHSLRERRPPTDWYKAALATKELKEPATYEEAVSGEDANLWMRAMDKEMTSLHANETHLATLSEARLVVKGFKQREGIDYQEVYAPMSKNTTLRTLLSIVAAQDLELQQLDVKTAFLNEELEEDIYMAQPPGYKEGGGGAAAVLAAAGANPNVDAGGGDAAVAWGTLPAAAAAAAAAAATGAAVAAGT